jgi:hypothetical protein
MKNWTIILTFSYPHEAHLVKTKLEFEGIEVLITDELTAQANPFYSNAIGGVKLKVQTKDLLKANKILKEHGYINEPIQKDDSFLQKIDILSSKIPFIGNLIFELRLLISTTILIIIIIVPIVLLSLPSKAERLIENRWCLENCIYKGKSYQPNTIQFLYINDGTCQEIIDFNKNWTVDFPGFNTGRIKASWKIENKKLRISNTDTLGHVFNGLYRIKFYHNSIVLQSENTTIHGYPKRSRW